MLLLITNLFNQVLCSCVSVVFNPVALSTYISKLRINDDSSLSLFIVTQQTLNFNSAQKLSLQYNLISKILD